MNVSGLSRRTRTVRILAGALGVALALGVAAGCGQPEAPRSPETRAVEEKAGDFLDYYEEVLRLSRRYTAWPDSFQTALRALPGTNLTEEEWIAWTAPYEDDARDLAERLEAVMQDLSEATK